MKYLLTLETQDDLIVICRLLNIFRRKGVRLLTFTMALTAEGYNLTVLLETAGADLDHLYHFLRRTEGVRHVTYYRQHDSEPASFVFVEGEAGSQDASRIAALLPGAKLLFAGQGTALLEAEHSAAEVSRQPGVLSFARVRTTRGEKVM
ncbi:MAG TPA: hypothetical protein VGX94_15470 [Terriglobia bacterium]|nr:hypothetical protein [Terriglobia bacterium]